MKKTMIAAAAAAAVVAGSFGAAGLANAETPSPSPKPTVTAQPTTTKTPKASSTATPREHKPGDGHGRNGHPGEFRMLGEMGKELAAKLGIDEATLKPAAEKVANQLREEYKDAATKPTIDELQAKFAAGLAKELGLPEAKVSQAIAEVRAAHQAQAEQTLKTRLDQAVKDGKLTQAEADAVLKAVQSGVLPGGLGHR